MDLFRDGAIKPLSPITRFDPIDIKEAFNHLQGRQTIGATCIEFPSDSTILLPDLHAGEARFRKDRGYLLVGGLGGLGKSAAIWLAERGAGCIIFLTRSASATAENADLIRDLDALGCMTQIVTGSVADARAVDRLVDNAPKLIAGVLHLALVLNVCHN